MNGHPRPWFCLLALCSVAPACGDDDAAGHSGDGADVEFGETAIVIVVNPMVNDGHTQDVPDSLGTIRDDVAVDASPGGSAETDADGLAVLGGVEQGDATLVFQGESALPFTVVADGDVYDLAVAYDGERVTAFENFPIRYPVAGSIVSFDSNGDRGAIAEALDTNDNVVFFESGRFVGDLEITGDDVLFFGEGFTERAVVIEGSVLVRGTGVRIRGFTITGDLTVLGNDFGMAYSVVQGETQINGNAVAFLRNAFCGAVSVPSSNASLLDNAGMAPLADPPSAICER
jgi:hypothetical protein